jgi:hypothetical protein
MDIYEEAKKLGIPMDHHESDLYLLKTPESKKLVAQIENRSTISTFTSPIDKKVWYDIAFAYTPFWEEVSKKGAKKDERTGKVERINKLKGNQSRILLLWLVKKGLLSSMEPSEIEKAFMVAEAYSPESQLKSF